MLLNALGMTEEYGNAECRNQTPGSTLVFADCID